MGRAAIMRAVRVVAVTSVVLFALAGNACAVSQCPLGCHKQRVLGVLKIKLGLLACAVACDRNFDCVHACRVDAWAAKDALRADTANCKENCAPGPALDETCLEGCSTTLVGC